ncbi:MAG: PQQ-binding-like beta-propeller repeat protein [Planctomycetes bacterium]|nr:PQQ-binding-like beta-propeller repeat protein [Planctomycetota bacterium]
MTKCCSGIARAAVLLFSCVLAPTVAAQDWLQWRGPRWDGSSEVQGLPEKLDASAIRWRAPLPGAGASTPIICGTRVFVTAADEESEKLVALCFDRESGKELWAKELGPTYTPAGRGKPTAIDNRSNYATPSAACDGERVFFFFGNGDLAATTLAGEELWKRNLQQDYGDFAFQWTFSATPTLHGGKLYLAILQRDQPTGRGAKKPEQPIPSFVLCIDPRTGKTDWKVERKAPAQMESLESYATIVPRVRKDGRTELIVLGGDVITGHDPADGKELWRWGTWNEGHREAWWRIVPTPVVGGDVVLVCAPKRAPVYAVKLDGEGPLPAEALVWKSEGRPNSVTSDVPTPLFHEGRFYVASDLANALSRVDPATGKVEWTVELDREFLWRASPIAAGGRIWMQNHHGTLYGFAPTDGKEVARLALGRDDDDGICASVAAAHGRLFVRTNRELVCLGKE